MDKTIWQMQKKRTRNFIKPIKERVPEFKGSSIYGLINLLILLIEIS